MTEGPGLELVSNSPNMTQEEQSWDPARQSEPTAEVSGTTLYSVMSLMHESLCINLQL